MASRSVAFLRMLSIRDIREQLKDKIRINSYESEKFIEETNDTDPVINTISEQVHNPLPSKSSEKSLRRTTKLPSKTCISREKQFSCLICDKKFKQNTSLRCHMNLHSGKRCFKCNYCERIFPRKITWMEHERRHTGEAPHSCAFCKKRFKQKSCLHYHELLHKGVKPHVCSVCSKGFIMSTALKIHMRVHTGEKPYDCDLCQKKFAHKANLKYHVLQHVYYNRHKCQKCSTLFVSQEELKEHCCKGAKKREIDIGELKRSVMKMMVENEGSKDERVEGSDGNIVVQLRDRMKGLLGDKKILDSD